MDQPSATAKSDESDSSDSNSSVKSKLITVPSIIVFSVNRPPNYTGCTGEEGSCEKCAYADEGFGGRSFGEKTQFLLYVTQIVCVFYAILSLKCVILI